MATPYYHDKTETPTTADAMNGTIVHIDYKEETVDTKLGLAAMSSIMAMAAESKAKREAADRRDNATYEYLVLDHYPVGTTVRLVNGEIAWVTSVGKKTMVKLKKSTVIRQAKDGYAILDGLFRVTNPS